MPEPGGQLARIPGSPPFDDEAERSVLGAILLGGKVEWAIDARLRPEHFFAPGRGLVFQAMLAIAQRGDGIDVETVRIELENTGRLSEVGGRAQLDQLAGIVPAVGNAPVYARQVVELYEWRLRARSAFLQLEAAAERDGDKYAAATRELDRYEDSNEVGFVDREQALLDYLGWVDERQRGENARVIPLPLLRLTNMMRGGFRPGDTTILAGWTSMGKSVFGDQCLEAAHDANLTACAYVNEMSNIERTARSLAGRAGVSFDKLLQPERLTPAEWKRVLDVGQNGGLPYALQPCAGWSADEIAASIRRHRWDLAMVDLVTQIPARDVADLDHISRTLTIAARQSGTHVILVVQLNQERLKRIDRPAPVLRDLRGTGAWANDAPNVIFVHRDEKVFDDVAEPGEDGHVRIAKQRNGPLGMELVTLNPVTMRFDPRTDYEWRGGAP